MVHGTHTAVCPAHSHTRTHTHTHTHTRTHTHTGNEFNTATIQRQGLIMVHGAHAAVCHAAQSPPTTAHLGGKAGGAMGVAESRRACQTWRRVRKRPRALVCWFSGEKRLIKETYFSEKRPVKKSCCQTFAGCTASTDERDKYIWKETCKRDIYI